MCQNNILKQLRSKPFNKIEADANVSYDNNNNNNNNSNDNNNDKNNNNDDDDDNNNDNNNKFDKILMHIKHINFDESGINKGYN